MLYAIDAKRAEFMSGLREEKVSLISEINSSLDLDI
jgi:hypothetical protein